MRQQEECTIHQGEAFSILRTFPAGTVDAVVTDPPYSSGDLSLTARQGDPAGKYQDSETVKQYPPLLGDGNRALLCRDRTASEEYAKIARKRCESVLKMRDANS